MKKSVLFISVFLLAMLSLGAVSAADENQTDVLNDQIIVTENNDFEMFYDDLPDDVKYGETVDFTVQFYTKGITGQIYVNVDNNRTEVYDVVGSTDNPVSFEIHEFGNHQLKIKYMGNYPTREDTFNYSVSDYLLDVHPKDYRFLYGDDAYLEVATLDGMTGEVNVVVANTTYYLKKYSDEDFDSLIKIDKDVLEYGDTITVNYIAGKNDKFWSKTYNFTVNLDSEIAIPEYGWVYGESKNITLYLPSRAQGTLEVSVDGKKYSSVSVVNGSAVLPLSINDIGRHTISGLYMDDEGFNISSGDVEVMVLPKINYLEKISTAGSTITFEMPKSTNGTIELYDEKWDYGEALILIGVGEIKNGKATFPVQFDEGENFIRIKYNIDGVDDTWILISSIENPDWDMKIIENEFVLKDADQAIFSIANAPYNINDNFTLKINATEYLYEFDGFDFRIDAGNLAYGKYIFEVEFLGDEYFSPTNASGYFTVAPIVVEIPNPIDISYGQSIEITLPKDATGKIKVLLDGVNIYSANVRDEAYFFDGYNHIDIYLDDLKYGTHDINVTYAGNYAKSFEVCKKINATYVFDTADSVTYNFEDLSLKLPQDMTSDITVTIDGEKCEVISRMGEFGMSRYAKIPENLSVGNHTLTLSYAGDEKYPQRALTKTLQVKASILMCYKEFNGFNGVELMIPDDAEGDFEVYLNGMQYSKTKASETRAVSFDGLGFGKYVLLAKYTGSDYNVADVENEYIINPQWIYPSAMLYKSDEYLSVDLEGVNGTLTLAGEDFYASKDLIGGKANISLSKLHLGENYLSVQLSIIDTDGILTDVYEDFVIINVVNPVIASSSAVFYASGSTYKVKIVDVNAEPVSGAKVVFYVNNKKVSASKTAKNGYVSFKINQAPGKYNVKISYGKLSVVKKLTVKHVLTFKAVTVKKSAKKLVLKATLKAKTYLKKKTVTFKFKGKTYKAKTNSKGIAKVTIKSNVLKKLKIGKKVSYQAKYLKDTVKKSSKVKK